MDDLEFENIDQIQTLINDYFSKYKDFNLIKFKKFLSEKNKTLNDIYIDLIKDLIPILKNIGNSFAKFNYEYLKKEEKILNKILTVMSESNSNIELTKENHKKFTYYFDEIYPIIINIFVKFADLVQRPIYKNDNNLKNLINKFKEQIIQLLKIIYDRDSNSVEHSLEESTFYEILIKQTFTRNILYDILKITMGAQRDIEGNENEISDRKGSLKLIKNIFEYLIKEIKVSNINIYFLYN